MTRILKRLVAKTTESSPIALHPMLVSASASKNQGRSCLSGRTLRQKPRSRAASCLANLLYFIKAWRLLLEYRMFSGFRGDDDRGDRSWPGSCHVLPLLCELTCFWIRYDEGATMALYTALNVCEFIYDRGPIDFWGMARGTAICYRRASCARHVDVPLGLSLATYSSRRRLACCRSRAFMI